MNKEKLKIINQQISKYEELYENELLRLETVIGSNHEKRCKFNINF